MLRHQVLHAVVGHRHGSDKLSTLLTSTSVLVHITGTPIDTAGGRFGTRTACRCCKACAQLMFIKLNGPQ